MWSCLPLDYLPVGGVQIRSPCISARSIRQRQAWMGRKGELLCKAVKYVHLKKRCPHPLLDPYLPANCGTNSTPPPPEETWRGIQQTLSWPFSAWNHEETHFWGESKVCRADEEGFQSTRSKVGSLPGWDGASFSLSKQLLSLFPPHCLNSQILVAESDYFGWIWWLHWTGKIFQEQEIPHWIWGIPSWDPPDPALNLYFDVSFSSPSAAFCRRMHEVWKPSWGFEISQSCGSGESGEMLCESRVSIASIHTCISL